VADDFVYRPLPPVSLQWSIPVHDHAWLPRRLELTIRSRVVAVVSNIMCLGWKSRVVQEVAQTMSICFPPGASPNSYVPSCVR